MNLNLDKSNPPRLMFTDFDGTLYDHGVRYVTSAYYNYRSSRLIKRHNIKLIIATGRATWNRIAGFQNYLLGMHSPDIMIRACGTYIYYRERSKYVLDLDWEQKMQNTVVKWAGDKGEYKWNKQEITERISPLLQKSLLFVEPANYPFQIRIPLFQIPIKSMLQLIEELKQLWTTGIKLVYTEKLYLTNNSEMFGGYIFLVPDCAGKDGSTQYIIDKYKDRVDTKPDCLFFGDASVDTPMLKMEFDNLGDKSKAYGLNLTHLAKEDIKPFVDNERVFDIPGSPPRNILKILKGNL